MTMPRSADDVDTNAARHGTNRHRRRLLVVMGMFAGASALRNALGAPAAPSVDAGSPQDAASIALRLGKDRGYADHGWLRTFHSFSFAGYTDPSHVSFGPLRVINEDRVSPGRGFPMHGHRDMEIVTYVLAGALEHRDSIGNGSVIQVADVQRMSAGSGVRHSEFNPSSREEVHFLQIWLYPNRAGLKPSYEQTRFDAASKQARFRLIASGNGDDGAVRINQDARIYAGSFTGTQAASHEIASGRQVYLHVARGAIEVNGLSLQAGDAVKAAALPLLALSGGREAEVLLFDLPTDWEA
jgi:redox-sensitive bicupin YhaK (pirin superfamily)